MTATAKGLLVGVLATVGAFVARIFSRRGGRIYPVPVEIVEGLDGYWVITAPSLPGCVSHGRTRDEALRNIGEAIELY